MSSSFICQDSSSLQNSSCSNLEITKHYALILYIPSIHVYRPHFTTKTMVGILIIIVEIFTMEFGHSLHVGGGGSGGAIVSAIGVVS